MMSPMRTATVAHDETHLSQFKLDPRCGLTDPGDNNRIVEGYRSPNHTDRWSRSLAMAAKYGLLPIHDDLNASDGTGILVEESVHPRGDPEEVTLATTPATSPPTFTGVHIDCH